MSETSKAVIIELSGGNVRNHHVNLRGAFGLFPDDCFGGSNKASSGKSIALQIAGETIETDIDEAKAIFRERSAIRRFFESENNGKRRPRFDRAGWPTILPRLKGVEARFPILSVMCRCPKCPS